MRQPDPPKPEITSDIDNERELGLLIDKAIEAADDQGKSLVAVYLSMARDELNDTPDESSELH